MKTLALAGTIALVLVSGEASAACNGNKLSATQLTALLTDNTVCAPVGASTPNMTWSELHQSGGSLIDYKRGPNDPMDPTETVGTWSVSGQGGNGVVTHNYSGGGSYSYSVYGDGNVGSTHSFCSGGTEVVATIKSGGGPC